MIEIAIDVGGRRCWVCPGGSRGARAGERGGARTHGDCVGRRGASHRRCDGARPCASTPIAATHQRRSSSSSFTATSAASRNNPASAPTTASRSYRFRPCNVGASSAMLSCRGSPGGPAGTGRDFIELLPANGSVIGGALSKTLADEKLVKRRKANHRCTRRADLHADA